MASGPAPPEGHSPSPAREAVQRWRLVVERGPLDADVGQREQLGAWDAALAACGLPVAGLDARPPKPRYSVAAPLGASLTGLAELVDVWLSERLPVWRVREALAGSMPPAHRLVDLHDVWMGAPALPGQVTASVYRAPLPATLDPGAVARACAGMLSAASLPRDRERGGGTTTYDLRPFIQDLGVDPGNRVARMTLRHDPERGIGRPQDVLGELSERLGVVIPPGELVRERLELAPAPGPGTIAPGSRGRRPPGRDRPGGRDRAPGPDRPPGSDGPGGRSRRSGPVR